MVTLRIICADVIDGLRQIADESVHCVVTSPPYWGLRDYGVPGQLGLEATPVEYVEGMVGVFRAVRRVLRKDGTLWLNMGDCYMGGGRGGGAENCKQRTNVESLDAAPNIKAPGFKTKDLVGMPWRLAFALQADGWWLRSDIIWHKPNPMPESVADRPTKAHEYIFLMARSKRYYYDTDASREKAVSRDGGPMCIPDGWATGGGPHTAVAHSRRTRRQVQQRGRKAAEGRNVRSVWTIAAQPYPAAHFATFPEELPTRCIIAGCPEGGTVLDPFGGAGTTGLVAAKLGRNAILIELNPKYVAMAKRRIAGEIPLLATVEVEGESAS